MTSPDPETPDPARVRCPTCRASQVWSATCRRCRSDLRLLAEFATGYDRSHRACLRHLRDDHPHAAFKEAQRCHAMAPSSDSLRLLAVAALKLGDWATAAALARSSLDLPR